MSQAQSAQISSELKEAAFQAVYQRQYNTDTAVRFIRGEVPASSYEMARQAINLVVKVQRKH